MTKTVTIEIARTILKIGDDCMLIFALLIVVSVVFYIYYKVTILRTKDLLIQKYMNGKARIFLNTFLISFGINQYIAVQIKTVLIISIIFILLGLIQVIGGFRRAKHYRKEWERLNPES